MRSADKLAEMLAFLNHPTTLSFCDSLGLFENRS